MSDSAAQGRAIAAVSAVVVTLDALPWIEQCLQSLTATDTVVVDHLSLIHI